MEVTNPGPGMIYDYLINVTRLAKALEGLEEHQTALGPLAEMLPAPRECMVLLYFSHGINPRAKRSCTVR